MVQDEIQAGWVLEKCPLTINLRDGAGQES